MTRELLNKVAKAHKIDLSYFDHISAKVNDKYTKVEIEFSNIEVLPNCRRFVNVTKVTLSVMAILKRCQELPEDYETNGEKWIYEIR